MDKKELKMGKFPLTNIEKKEWVNEYYEQLVENLVKLKDNKSASVEILILIREFCTDEKYWSALEELRDGKNESIMHSKIEIENDSDLFWEMFDEFVYKK
jgi:hypothetical protein|tara:strand:- start:366 stop:665 length:300 start_codon:yes stop_codon:yes gene_type:complete